MTDRAEALAKALEEMLEGDADAIAEAAAIGIPFPDELLTTYNNARAALEAYRSQPSGWISVEDRMPEPGTECLVWVVSSPWAKPGNHYVALDTWHAQSEASLSFSSATVPIGLGWGDYEFDEVSHWQLPPTPPSNITGEQA